MYQKVLTVAEIKELYPNQWVLLGNPELKKPKSNGNVLNRLVKGTLLFASKDKRELAYKAKELVAGYEETTCIYTGYIPKKRIFLL